MGDIDSKALAEKIKRGDRFALSRGITLIESTLPEHRRRGSELLDACMPSTGGAMRIGVSGPPGVGKSSWIEAVGMELLGRGKKVAVLAVDPASRLSKGSILGDKTRMAELSRHDDAYVRPTSSGGQLGGVARHTREAMLLCEAAGFDVVLIETVGVGQSEIAVYDMADCFVLLVQPGSGDELQGIKRGIVELAHLLIVHKADGEQEALARRARSDFGKALHLLHPSDDGWTTKVLTGSIHKPELISKNIEAIVEYFEHLRSKSLLEEKRMEQNLLWFDRTVRDALLDQLMGSEEFRDKMAAAREKVRRGQLSVGSAVGGILNFGF